MDATPEQVAEGTALVHILSSVLDRMVRANAHLALSDPGQVTKFHALKAPGIGILPYLERIHKYASCSNECFILALIYIDRLIKRNNFLLTELNVHRVVITAILLAAKFFDDAYYNNAYYSRVGGVLVSEMNGLEVDFLFRINFSLHVAPDVFQRYKNELVSQAPAPASMAPQRLQVVEEVIAPSNDQIMDGSSMAQHYPIQPISCAPTIQMHPPPSQEAQVSSHIAAVNAAVHHQANAYIEADIQMDHSSTINALNATNDIYFQSNNFPHQLLQRANSMPVASVPTRCAMNPPYSAPLLSMVANDAFLIVDNQICPIQNALIHHHHGLNHYSDTSTFHQLQHDGVSYQISRDSLMAGHY